MVRDHALWGWGSQEACWDVMIRRKQMKTQRRRVHREERDERQGSKEAGKILAELGLGVAVAGVKAAPRRRTRKEENYFGG